ncbi:MAG: hypothetical protein HWN67_20780 [Candidatus Helarchaeota archaeon]|nr:hypothetical protein [Candidatus Helarchaeota archaeon]
MELIKISRKPHVISEISMKDFNILKNKGILTRIRYGKADINIDFLKNWYDYIKIKFGIGIVDNNVIKDSQLDDEFKNFLKEKYEITNPNLINFLQKYFRELIIGFRIT